MRSRARGRTWASGALAVGLWSSVFGLADTHAAQTNPQPVRIEHTRPVTNGKASDAEDLLNEAIRRSPTIEAMLLELERCDLIVYVEVRPLRPKLYGSLNFMVSTRRARFVRVSIDSLINRPLQLASLGHELQHALEIGRAPDVRDDDSLARLLERIGWLRWTPSWFETQAALDAGERVFAEVIDPSVQKMRSAQRPVAVLAPRAP